jgi:hypothetical protein
MCNIGATTYNRRQEFKIHEKIDGMNSQALI